MCRMIGITPYRYDEHRTILDEFCLLAEKGKLFPGDPPGHADGWGIGFYRAGRAVLHRSAASILAERSRIREILKEASPSPVLILHLRKSAWPETTTVENAHPFEFRNVLFAHNGTVRDYQKLLADIPAEYLPREGALDTEVFLRYVTRPRPTMLPLDEAFLDAAGAIRRNNTYSSLTSLFTDGTSLYAWRDFTKHPDYYTLHHAEAGSSHIVSSEPVSSALRWTLLEKERLYRYL